MKKWIVLCIVFVFFFAGLSFGQDCGKCPAKLNCAKAKLQKDKAKDMANLIVYITKSDKKYHKEDCKLVKEKVKMKLGEAKEKGFTPCSSCFPAPKKEKEVKKTDSPEKE